MRNRQAGEDSTENPRRRWRGVGRPLFAAVPVRSRLRCLVAAWWFTGDPVRAVPVLVVATPVPAEVSPVPVALGGRIVASGAVAEC